MRHCYRGRGVFRLREKVETLQPLESYTDSKVYSLSACETVSVPEIVYFCTSVFWRASVQAWQLLDKVYGPISLGDKYQEQIRKYLLGQSEFPDSAAVLVVLSGLKTPHLHFSFPDTVRVDSCYCHRLHIPGVDFLFHVGKGIGDEKLACILKSPLHPIFVATDGDAHAQRTVLRLMGKVAPKWGTYPLVEGTEL